MATYSHVVVVMSILLSLSITQLLKGIAQLYRSRSRVKLYWLHSAWVVLLIFFSLLLWWTYWQYREIQEWNFFRFVLYLSPTVVFYYITAIAIPDPSENIEDLRQYYFANRAGFFGTFAFYGVLAGLTAILVRGLPVFDPSNLVRLAMVILLLIAMRSTKERVHTTVLALGIILMLVFIVLFQFRLG